jgi:hypothetical protein
LILNKTLALFEHLKVLVRAVPHWAHFSLARWRFPVWGFLVFVLDM